MFIAPMSASATGIPLPTLPPQSVIDTVLAATGGAGFTALDAPNTVINTLATFTGVFANVQNTLDRTQAASYLDTNGALLETVIPIANSASAVILPMITLPGGGSPPGMIIGATFQPSRPAGRQVMVIALVFKKNAFSCISVDDCKDPKKIRFYYNSTQYDEYDLKKKNYIDTDGDGGVEWIDEGASLSQDFSCVTLGLRQVCWEPSSSALRQTPTPRDIANTAYSHFSSIYNLSVGFEIDDAIPDLLGLSRRTACSTQLMAATSFSSLSSCHPNVVFTASTSVVFTQPIGIFVVTEAIDLRAYNTAGTLVGTLPIGEYLVIDATPTISAPGAATVTFLVNADTLNHYLIPSTRTQGFGLGDSDPRQAGIRDGFMSFVGWGR